MMQRTLAPPCDRMASKASAASPPSSVVRAVDEELLDIGLEVAEVCDGRPFPISPLSSSVLRHSRSAVPPMSSASSTTGEHALLIGYRRCDPESIPSQAEVYSSS